MMPSIDIAMTLVTPPPLLPAHCSTSVASSRTKPTPISLETLAPFPATKHARRLRFGGLLLCFFCFLMLSYHHLIAWGKALLLPSSPVVAILYFFGTRGAPTGQGFDPWLWHPNPFALMVVGFESLVAACDMVKKCAFSPRSHQPFSPSFLKTYWSTSFLKYRKWVTGNNAHRGKGHSVTQPHYQAPRPKTLWNRSPTVWVG